MSTILDAWRTALVWCLTHAPVTAEHVRPPPSAEDVAAVRKRFRRPWPDDLVDWIGVQDGYVATIDSGLGVLPGWTPLELSDIAVAAEEVDGFQEFIQGEDVVGAASEWLPPLVPLARDVATDLLVVDLRPGLTHGGLLRWSPDDGLTERSMGSLTDFLISVSRGLLAGDAVEGLWPRVRNDVLYWQNERDDVELPGAAGSLAWSAFVAQVALHKGAVWDDGDPFILEPTPAEFDAYQCRSRLVEAMSEYSLWVRDAVAANLAASELSAVELGSLIPLLSGRMKVRSLEVLELYATFQGLVA